MLITSWLADAQAVRPYSWVEVSGGGGMETNGRECGLEDFHGGLLGIWYLYAKLRECSENCDNPVNDVGTPGLRVRYWLIVNMHPSDAPAVRLDMLVLCSIPSMVIYLFYSIHDFSI